jgi:hypothetical protein
MTVRKSDQTAPFTIENMSVTVTYLEMHSAAEFRPRRCLEPAFRVEEGGVGNAAQARVGGVTRGLGGFDGAVGLGDRLD